MKRQNKIVPSTLCLLTLSTVSLGGLVAGCTPSARQDVGAAGANLDSAATKSAVATDKAIDNTGKAIDKGAADTGKAIDKSVTDAGKAVDKTAMDAGKAIDKSAADAGKDLKTGTDKVVAGTESTLAKAGSDVKAGSETVTLTPKVKSAIFADDSVKIADLNIDTHSDSKQVVVMGTAPSATAKSKAMADAKGAMAGDTSGYTLVDKLMVAGK